MHMYIPAYTCTCTSMHVQVVAPPELLPSRSALAIYLICMCVYVYIYICMYTCVYLSCTYMCHHLNLQHNHHSTTTYMSSTITVYTYRPVIYRWYKGINFNMYTCRWIYDTYMYMYVYIYIHTYTHVDYWIFFSLSVVAHGRPAHWENASFRAQGCGGMIFICMCQKIYIYIYIHTHVCICI